MPVKRTRLAARRKAVGFSQDKLAERLQVDRSTIVRWGCVEYDMGWKGAAETSRIAALQIGRETGHGEIQAWSWEMAAWFALTQGRTGDIPAYVDVGQRVGGNHSVVIQLDAQLAKAGARMGDSVLVSRALESGYAKMSHMPKPDNPRNHFVIDPARLPPSILARPASGTPANCSSMTAWLPRKVPSACG